MPVVKNCLDAMSATKRKYIIAFYIVFTLGLISLSHRIGYGLGNVVAHYINASIQYRPWAKTCLELAKPNQLLSYLFPAICLFFYYFLACLHLNGYVKFRNKLFLEGSDSKKIILYLVLAGVVNLFLLTAEDDYRTGLLVWAALFLFPFWKMGLNVIGKKYLWIGWVALFVLLLFQSIIMLWPYYFQSAPLISNDYMDMPEQTFIGQNLIDNTSYINQHRIGGFLKYDPRLPAESQQLLVAGKDYISLRKTTELSQFIAMHSDYYRYDDFYQGLFVNGLLTSADSDALCKLTDLKSCEAITYYYQWNSLLGKRSYDSMESTFIKLNQYEMSAQSVAGHYFHHHNAFLGPINAYSLGKPAAQTMFLYGWLNTVVLSKLLSQAGVISFAAYLKTTYLFYPLYFLMIALSAIIIFRDFGWVFLVVIISLTSIFAMGFEAIHLAPGFNPVRHFFDLFILLCWYGYLFARRNKILYFGLAMVFSILAYLACKEFGLFMFIGLIAAYFFQMINGIKAKITEVIITILGVLALCVAFVSIKMGSNPDSIYSFSGVSVPPTSVMQVWLTLFVISVGYIFLFLWRWQDNRWKFLALFLFIYLQLSLIYNIWYSDRGHLLVFAAAWAFFGAMLFRELLSSCAQLKKVEYYVLVVLVAWVFAFFYMPLSITYVKSEDQYLTIFKEHKVYYWNIPTAKFYSTMDPRPFYDAIRLINKYSDKKGIYIISKYDNSLPFFAKKYSEMPFLQTDLSIVSDKEMQIAINAILTAKPDYLFVDSDIERNRVGDTSWLNDPLLSPDIYALGRGRVLVLDNLSALFAAVKSSYRPIEQGQIITVYKLKKQGVQ